MAKDHLIVFVCEHGAAKSVIAAAYFNKMAVQAGLDSRAVARGTDPDDELSPKAIHGLREDGLVPIESVPKKLSRGDIESAQQLITFGELAEGHQQNVNVEQWNNIPPVSENYGLARDAIVKQIESLIKKLR